MYFGRIMQIMLMLVMLASVAIGQDLTVQHEKNYRTFEAIVLHLPELPEGHPFVEWQANWFGTDQGKQVMRPAKVLNIGQKLAVWERPGRIVGRATVAVTGEDDKIVRLGKDKLPFVTMDFDFTISDSNDPNPNPPPGPNPPGPVVVDIPGAWVVIVEQTEERSIDTAKIVNGTAYWQGYAARKLNYRFYDLDSKEAETYKPHVNAVGGVPALLIQEPSGKVIAKRKLPATITEIDTFVKENTGR